MWINCKEKMPEDMEVVIALYLGLWPGRGNGGITDTYAVDGKWFNLPEGVSVIGWMQIPNTEHLPITEHYAPPDIVSVNLLGSVETDIPSIVELVFEGDHSEIKPPK
ncbi:DUF551 domain-containing protein [Litoribacillus peritrichatus]|uniref:DUF551 domain-containing protein n=1 Tax=Litoribacillus peritrichatus TaxID=718191 RepID=A0ABP7ML69_9GAMM